MPATSAPGTTSPSGSVVRPPLLSIDDALGMDVETMATLFKEHINPGQFYFMRRLGLHKTKIESADGMHYVDQHGRRILDFFGGFGSLAFGHNHPRIIAARRRFQDEHRHDIAMAFLSQYNAALAANLAACSPGDLDMVFLATSGSEAMESALKLAERAAGLLKRRILYAGNSFHGKTKGALAATDGGLYRAQFSLPTNMVRVPFGDLDALRRELVADRSIGTVVLETIQGGGGIIEADESYWRGLRAACDELGVIWVADEVQCGYGRTGRFYAFEHYGVTPDITALAKSLGGGKSAIGATIARRDLFMRAYGSPKTAMIHAASTLSGMGGASFTAIEALNVLYDEHLIDNAGTTGGYLIERLNVLQGRHPQFIKEVRGRGFMVGLELHDVAEAVPAFLQSITRRQEARLKGSLAAAVGALLFKDYDILVAFTEYNRNVIRLEPALICDSDHVDTFADALDDLLSRGLMRIVRDFARIQLG